MSLRIAHISDIHQGLHYAGPSPLSRFQDIEKILDWTADKLIEEKVDLCLVCGDCFKDAKVMFDRGTDETISIGNWLRKLSNAGIVVVAISGTPSHDSLAGYKFLEQMQIPNVAIRTTPMIIEPPNTINQISIACLPGLNRSALLTQDEYKGLLPEQVHRIMTDKITQLCVGMAGQMPNDKPKFLMAHMTYQGADTGFTDLLMQHEPILTREAVAGFDLVCLGHIHRPQQIDNKVFYSGPIERLSFNDEDIEPGFVIYERQENSLLAAFTAKFIETPARRFVTQTFTEPLETVNGLYEALAYADVKDAIVKLKYSCSEEVAKQLNRKALEKALYDAGAFYVSEIKADIQRTDRSRDSEVTESLSVGQALDRWCVQQGIDETERAALAAMTNALLEGVPD